MSTRIQIFLKPHKYINLHRSTFHPQDTSESAHQNCIILKLPSKTPSTEMRVKRNLVSKMSRFLWRWGPYNHKAMCLTKKLTCTREFVTDTVDKGKYKLHDIFWGHLTMIQLYTSVWSQYIYKLISSISALLHTKYRIQCTKEWVRMNGIWPWQVGLHYFRRKLTFSEFKNIKILQCMSKRREWIFSGFMPTW